MSKNPFFQHGNEVKKNARNKFGLDQTKVSDFKGEVTDDDLNNEAVETLEDRAKDFNKKML
ncbi:MAG: hypothetical protein A4E53_01262 [Pelotomaculum sp. PtaB.Bin104]|nr:MAG: hypothetical protein A4E53_01262 [Pelotomaculum sp. PtaB.Bin104]